MVNTRKWRLAFSKPEVVITLDHVTDRDVVSSATTMFSGVAITMQHQLRCHFVDIFEKFKMAANEFYLAGKK